MAEFYYSNLARNLPDCYRKDKDSNNYKILEIERTSNQGLREMLYQIGNILDIENAEGAILDMYGKRFGQARGKADDTQYRLMIKSKIVRSLSSGSYKDVVDAICYTFNCEPSDVLITESPEQPMTVKIEKTPLEAVIGAGFSSRQAEQIIKSLLPVCVTVDSVLFDGTFEFSDAEDEYDEEKGFSEAENGTIGGYLGWTGADDSIDELPI